MIRFIERFLIVPSGVGAGTRFRLRDWQKEFIYDVYAPLDKAGLRVVKQAVLSMARKNGKTALIAALVLVHLVGPEAIVNGEIYSAANDSDQAAQVFKFCTQMIERAPKLRERLTVVDSRKRIVCLGNGSVYIALSRDAKTKHGFNPSCVIYDELAQSISRDLFDALDTGQGAREEPLFFVISTQNKDPGHILSELIDDGLDSKDPTTVCHLYAVPDDEEDIFDESVWGMANPALGDFRLLADFRKRADRAYRRPSFEAAFRNLYLNQRVSTTSPLIHAPDWRACMAPVTLRAKEPIYLGLDLSARNDLTAMVAVSAEDGDRVGAWFWKPADVIDEHTKRDRFNYQKMVEADLIIPVPGLVVDYRYVAATLEDVSLEYEIAGIAFDRWRILDFKKAAEEIGLKIWVESKEKTKVPPKSAIRMVPWGQGFKDMGPAVDEFETTVLNKTLQHDGNAVLTWNISNAECDTDPAGNRKLTKAKARFRIDGAQALVMAVGLKARDAVEHKPRTSIYSRPELWQDEEQAHA